jgi:hypothetical protein
VNSKKITINILLVVVQYDLNASFESKSYLKASIFYFMVLSTFPLLFRRNIALLPTSKECHTVEL